MRSNIYKQAKKEMRSLKLLAICYFGIGFVFTTPRIRGALLESVRDFIDELSNHLEDKTKC